MTGFRVKSNEAATHDIVGVIEGSVEGGRATTKIRIFRVVPNTSYLQKGVWQAGASWETTQTPVLAAKWVSGHPLQTLWWNTHAPSVPMQMIGKRHATNDLVTRSTTPNGSRHATQAATAPSLRPEARICAKHLCVSNTTA